MGNELSSADDDRKRSKSRRHKDAATLLLDTICGSRGSFYYDDEDTPRYHRRDTYDDDDSDYSDDETYDSSIRHGKGRRKKDRKSKMKNDSDSLISNEDDDRKRRSKHVKKSGSSYDEDPSVVGTNSIEVEHQNKSSNITANINNNTSFTNSPDNSSAVPNSASKSSLGKPLASSFAKRCYFTKAGIGGTTQHYEGLTLTGNTVLMLASSMKLKGCPTICDEDLRRVEASFPNQFSRLPDELMLSSGWKRISKYCHFSNKPIADGTPFFHSRERVHPTTGGYYFLLASTVGMARAQDVEPLTLDLLILLQTDYPNQCDVAPTKLIEDPDQWTLVNKFCFFSGGPINTEEDVYYEADFDGNPIYMLAFLSPSLTPEELYRLNDITGENAIKNVEGVEEVERVYELTERDFDDLRLYHLGPCRALPNYVLSPGAWKKVLPSHFIECREKALARAYEYEVHAQEAVAAATGKFPISPAESGSIGQSIDGRGMDIGAQGGGYEEFGRQEQDFAYNDGAPSPLHDPMNGFEPGFQSPEEDPFIQSDDQQFPQSQNQHPDYDNQQYTHYDPNFSNYTSPETAGSDQSGSNVESPEKADPYEQQQNAHREVYDEGSMLPEDRPMDEAMASKVARELDYDDPSFEAEDRPDPSGTELSPARRRLDPPVDSQYYEQPEQTEFSITSPNRPDSAPNFSIASPNTDSLFPEQNGDVTSQGSASDKQSNVGSTYSNYEEPPTPKSLITSPPYSPARHARQSPSPSQRSQGFESPARSIRSVSAKTESPRTPITPFSEKRGSPSPSRLDNNVILGSNKNDVSGISYSPKASPRVESDEKSLSSNEEEIMKVDIPPPPPDDQSTPSPSLRLPSPSSQSRGKRSPKMDSDDVTVSSEYSKSSAMRGAQELLKKNRQRRLEIMARRRQQQQARKTKQPVEDEDNSTFTNEIPDENSVPSRMSRNASPSLSLKKSVTAKPPNSPKVSTHSQDTKTKDFDALSGVSNPSSILTDETSPAEKNARRALILQMAKNRMKKGKNSVESSSKTKDAGKDTAEAGSTIGSTISNGSLD